ncbi:hypothetical protein LTR70_000344 [Exophiala xenobiotica]|uniref:Uncharacterized protein n=1 Tax=Lithohypha guttulata TaxID=1690604 RepID=A0ABR0KPL0_9EURO|nr:hypothetical protein LTR24_000047 [Lithohypha guttulata]KAK5330514.1 hypothetical protein LTR70_000344 [Exophiala xenobiotica]
MAADGLEKFSGKPSLQGEEGAILLDVVDQLRDLGSITHELSLPQIVVVGDQSSGKSSVLEAISGLSFPTNEGLCTQFATEVVLRRSKTTRTTISIKSANNARKEAIKDFSEKWKNADLEQLAVMVDEAKSIMGISDQNRFSEDVLKLEVCGPNQDHLTLVDLPGLFQNTEINQSPRDRDVVRNLVTSYVAQPRTVVLAILSCGSDYQVQGILDLLKGIDKSGERTLGVVTMPDMLKEGTPRFTAFKALIDNRKWPLRLGWHVLRNPDFTEKQDSRCDRLRIEKAFFEQHSWNTVPTSNRGASALRKRLSEMLKTHISKELPDILEDIDNAIKRCEAEKGRLGDERDTPEKQRNYLMDIGEKFKHLMTCALEGEYSDSYFDAESHRLRALIMNANETYANTMMKFGHQWELKGVNEHGQQPQQLFAMASKHFAFRVARPELIEHEKLVNQVIVMQQSHRGLELPGLPQPRLVGKLFKQQSEKWKTITQVHVDHIFDTTKQFVEDLLTHIAGGKSSAALLSEIVDPDFEAREKFLRRKVEEVLKPYTNEKPMTLNTNYVSSLQSASNADEISKSGPWLKQHTEGEVQSGRKIIESMQAYYHIALNVLLDNVALLVIEHSLLDDLSQTISPRSMQKQPDTQLERLAGESHDVVARRQMLHQMLQEYRRGHQLIRAHSRRPLRSSNIDWSKATQPGISLGATYPAAGISTPAPSILDSQQNTQMINGSASGASSKPTPPQEGPIFWSSALSPAVNQNPAKVMSSTPERTVSFFASPAAPTSIFQSGGSVGPNPTALPNQAPPSRSSFGPSLTPRDGPSFPNPFSRPGSASNSATSAGSRSGSPGVVKSPLLGHTPVSSKVGA